MKQAFAIRMPGIVRFMSEVIITSDVSLSVPAIQECTTSVGAPRDEWRRRR